MMYFALIGDIIDSKTAQNRQEIQKKLQRCLDSLNVAYETVIASKFSITLGDEFQGLLKIDAPVFRIIDEIKRAVAEVELRFGLGLGRIVTDINPEQSIGADGPAYWFAREAINYVHQKNDYGHTQLAVRLEDKFCEDVVNSLIAAGEAIKSDWRDSQKILLETLLDLDIYDEQFDQQLLGQRLHLVPSALSKRLKSSSLKIYLRTRKSALRLLQAAGKEN